MTPAVDPRAIEPPTFEHFYAVEYAAVVRIAYALTGRYSLAEELAQDAFLDAYRKWGTLSGYDEPSAWVRRAVANRSVSAWRRAATEARLVTRLKRERPRASTLLEGDDAVWAAIRELPTRQRQVIVFIVVDDRPVAEVAEILGCTENSVRTHLRRARLRLAHQLHERDESDES